MTTKASLFAALLVVSLSAQTPPKCKVSGRLTNSVTNEAVRKAKVSLHPDDPTKTVYNVETDAAGKFLLENIEPGRYTLEGEKQGFVASWYGATRPEGAGSEIELKADKETSDLVLKLIPQGIISGRVLDDEGEPVAGVMVIALHNMYMNGHRQLVPVASSAQIQTNDLGEYRVSGLSPGHYYVQASALSLMAQINLQGTAKAEAPPSNVPEEGLVPVFYPNSLDVSGASPIEVGAGAEIRGMDLRLKKARVMRVSGKLQDAAGEPLKGGVVMLYRRVSGAMSIVPSAMAMAQSGKGEFEVRGLAPGDYNVMAMATGDPANMKMTMSQMQVTDQPAKDLVIRVGAGADLNVAARHAAGVSGDFTNIRVMLQVDDNPMASLSNGQLGKDGALVLKHVSPDKYRLMVIGIPPDNYLLSARMGNADVLESGLDVRNGVAGPLELTIGGPAARISGTVKNEKGELVPGAIVTVIAKDPKQRTDMKHTVTADQNGHFVLGGIVPAEYRVYAWEDIEQGAGEDEEFVKPFEKMRTDVDLSRTSTAAAPLDLKLITRAAVLDAQTRK